MLMLGAIVGEVRHVLYRKMDLNYEMVYRYEWVCFILSLLLIYEDVFNFTSVLLRFEMLL